MSSPAKSCEINDMRDSRDFTHCSFSQHKKTEVRGELIHNMLIRKLDACCHWVAELVCAGHYAFLWEIILHYLAKYINLGNPKLPIYVLMRFNDFKSIVKQGNFINEIDLRNNPQIRQLFAELICNLSVSHKKPAFEPMVSHKQSNFDIMELSTLLMAPPTTIDTISHLLNNDDPHELFTIFTEFAYNIDNRDLSNACHWIDWIIQYQAHCIKAKEPIVGYRRAHIPVDPKFQTNLIWIMWDILNHHSNTPLLQKVVQALMNLFCIQYKMGVCEKRKQLLFYAVSIITESVDFTIDIITPTYKGKVEEILEQNDKYYRELKKNEIAPKTDYMFMNIKDQRAHNLKMGVAKMEMLATIENR